MTHGVKLNAREEGGYTAMLGPFTLGTVTQGPVWSSSPRSGASVGWFIRVEGERPYPVPYDTRRDAVQGLMASRWGQLVQGMNARAGGS